MSEEQVLTDDEKAALLEGVETGVIEVQSFKGPRYAKVRAFEIPARSRIATNSYPRLQRLNRRFADRASRATEQLVDDDVAIIPGSIDSCSYSEYCDRNPEFSLVLEFSAAPLPATTLIYLPAEFLRLFVEAFYGGRDNDPIESNADTFTRGETNVGILFCRELMATLANVWNGLIEIEPDHAGTHLSTDIIDGFDTSDTVVSADFDIRFAGVDHAFHIVWPVAQVASLLPVFEGQKRERDAAQDAHWENVLRTRLADAVVSVASRVPCNQLTLGAAADLKPGDIVDLEDPRMSLLFVGNVPIMAGRFGVADGRRAMEAGSWLGQTDSPAQQ